MNDSQSKHRKSLNSSQLSILYDLYKFRFATSDLLMKSQGLKTKRSLYPRLKILLDQEYIGRNYDSSYRLQNKYATYYLRTNGINVLKNDATFNKRVLVNIARDNKRTDKFISDCLNIFTIYADFKHLYGDRFRFFTDSYLRNFKYFPRPLPGAYIQFKDDESQHYFIDYIAPNVQFFVRRKLINQYIEYARRKIWEKETETEQPIIILICETEPLRYSVERQVKKAHGDTLSFVQFVVTTRVRLARGI